MPIEKSQMVEIMQEFKIDFLKELKEQIIPDLKAEILQELKKYRGRVDKVESQIKQLNDGITTVITENARLQTQIADCSTKISLLENRVVNIEEENKELIIEKDVSALKIHNLKWKLEDRTNRDMRNTLIFKGVPEKKDESTWDKTESVLAGIISKTCDMDIEETIDMFERVHRGRPRQYNNDKRDIYVRFKFWKDSEYVKDRFLESFRDKKNNGIFVEQMYGYETTKRREQALMTRKQLKVRKEITSGYLKFPAKLYVRKTNCKNYVLYEDFSRMEVPEVNKDAAVYDVDA